MPNTEDEQTANADRAEAATISREDIVGSAREPQDHLARPGWGVWTPEGPLTGDPDGTLRGELEVADEESRRVSVDPIRSAPSGVYDPLAEPAARDFRRDTDE